MKQFSLDRERKEAENQTSQQQALQRGAAELQEMTAQLNKKFRSAEDFKAVILEQIAENKPLSFIARSTKLSVAEIQDALERWHAQPTQLV